jgi:MoaA/NifB/PqqE/SkfB family radical SAM enzyme
VQLSEKTEKGDVMTIEMRQLVEDLRGFPKTGAYGGEPMDPEQVIKELDKDIKNRQELGIYPKEFKSPLGCQMELTYKCNLKCIQCYNQSGLGRNTWEEMSIKKWIDITNQLIKAEVAQVVITGGEPLLLGEDLFRIMDLLNDSGVTFLFITNGFLLDDKAIDRLSKYTFSRFQISIDGSRSRIHDEIRGVKGSFKKAIHGVVKAKSLGLPLVIAHIVMKQNVDYVSEMIDLAFDLGALHIIADKFEEVGRGYLNRSDIGISEEQRIEVHDIVEKKRQEYYQKMYVTPVTDTAVIFRRYIVDPTRVILIRPNGDVRLDCVLPFTIGNVLKEDIQPMWDRIGKRAWLHPKILEYVHKITSDKDVGRVHPVPHVDPDILVN